MREDVITAITLLLGNDHSVPPEQRRKILEACRSPSVSTRPRLATGQQAANILGCCSRTVFRWAASGYLHAIHYGPRRIRFDLDEVESLASRGTTKKDEKL